MTIIADANIILSAIISPSGPISKLIFTNCHIVDFVLPEYAIEEIELHKSRICTVTNTSPADFDKIKDLLLPKFIVFSAELIDKTTLNKAIILTKDIDEKDALYIAFSLALDALLWTADKKLMKAVRRKKYYKIVTTPELKNILKGL